MKHLVDLFFKVRLPGEAFWVSGAQPIYEGLFTARVENNLQCYPYKVGDRIELSLDHVVGPGLR